MSAIAKINTPTSGTPIIFATTGVKNPEAWISSLTKSLISGKERLCCFPSIMGMIPESLPFTTLSALTRIIKSGLNPIFKAPERKMQRLFLSSATTTQSFKLNFSFSSIWQRIFNLPLGSMASPRISPVNLSSLVSTSIP